MHCTSSYPTETRDVNLNVINEMKKVLKNVSLVIPHITTASQQS